MPCEQERHFRLVTGPLDGDTRGSKLSEAESLALQFFDGSILQLCAGVFSPCMRGH